MSVATPLRPFGRRDPPAPLPDSKSTFEPPLKRELTRRLFLICSFFYGYEWLVSLISTLDFTRGPPLGVLGQLVATSLVALFALVIGAIPPLILRGHAVSALYIVGMHLSQGDTVTLTIFASMLSEKYTPLPTRAETFLALISQARTWRTLACFTGSGFSLIVLHVAFLNLSEWEDTKLSILSPTRRNAFRLNERFFYLAFFNTCLGFVFASRDLIRQRWIVRWPYFDRHSDATIPAPSPVVLQSILSVLNLKAIISTTIITVMHVFLFPIWYHVIRVLALPILRNLPWLSGLTRPLLHGFGRTWTVNISWFRLFALGFKTSIGWELVESAFDHWVTKPIYVSQKAPNPNQALVAGLHSQDRYFKHNAYLELLDLARSQSTAAATRRTALFTDTKTNPTLWNAVVRELLMSLGRDYQCLLRRGKPAPTPPPPPPPSILRTPRTPSMPLIRQPILKPSPRSLIDSFASDGAVTEVLTTIASLPESVDIPNVFLPSTPSTPRAVKEVVNTAEAKTTNVVKKVESTVTSLSRTGIVKVVLASAESKLPREWRVKEWWMNVSVERQARSCLPEGVLDVISIDALSHLVATSLKDDTLGNVQRDIPRVLEALLSFLAEVEAFQAELENKFPQQRPQSDGADESRLEDVKAARDVARAIQIVVPVLNALRAGIGHIAKTFGEKLSVFKFPPVTARRLQSFMDYL